MNKKPLKLWTTAMVTSVILLGSVIFRVTPPAAAAQGTPQLETGPDLKHLLQSPTGLSSPSIEVYSDTGVLIRQWGGVSNINYVDTFIAFTFDGQHIAISSSCHTIITGCPRNWW